MVLRMKTQNFLIIKVLYCISVSIFIIPAFLPTFSGYSYGEKLIAYGYIVYTPAGYIGIILTIISIILLRPLKVRKAVMYGIIGCVFIACYFALIPSITHNYHSVRFGIGFFISISSFIMLCIINTILFRYREKEEFSKRETELIKRVAMIRKKQLELEKREQALEAKLKLIPERRIISDKIKIVLSYSSFDNEYFQIKQTGKALEKHSRISKIIYWEINGREYVRKFIEETLEIADVLVLFCSENSNRSEAMKTIWQTAFKLRDEGLVKIVPVYENEYNIPSLLMPILNVKFTRDDLVGFIQNLYREILR